MASAWHVAAAISGASAVGAGAYGAHVLKSDNPMYKDVFARGNEYHLVHSLLMAVAPAARRPNVVGGLAAAGIVMFAGSCYAVALAEDRSKGVLAPFGGMAMIGAWLALAL